MRRWALCFGMLVTIAGCERSSTTSNERPRDAAPVPTPKPAPDAGPPFPAKPAMFPACSAAYAARPDRDASPMCYVVGGAFDVPGLGYQPAHNDHVTLSDFLIDQHEVTSAQFVKFLNEAWHVDKCVNPNNICRSGQPSDELPIVYGNGRFEVRGGQGNLPMTWVTHDLANAFCAWAGKQLPSYGQWDVAAHLSPSGKRTKWAWGDDWKKGMMNCSEAVCADGFANAAPPGSVHDTSAWGVEDMEGNVEERVTNCDGSSCKEYSAGTSWAADRRPDAFEPMPNDDVTASGFRCARSTAL